MVGLTSLALRRSLVDPSAQLGSRTCTLLQASGARCFLHFGEFFASTGRSAATPLPAAAASLRTRVGVGDASAAQQGDDIALVRLPSVTPSGTPVGAELPRDSSPSPERLWSALRSATLGTNHKPTRSSHELSSPRLLRKISSTEFKVPRGVQVVS